MSSRRRQLSRRRVTPKRRTPRARTPRVFSRTPRLTRRKSKTPRRSYRRRYRLHGGEAKCPICQESIEQTNEAPQNGIVELNCGHRYHGTCLSDAQKNDENKVQTCYVCRTPVTLVTQIDAPFPDAADTLNAKRSREVEMEVTASRKRRRDQEAGLGAGVEDDDTTRVNRLAERRRRDESSARERYLLQERAGPYARYARHALWFRNTPDTMPPYTTEWRNEVYYRRRMFGRDMFFYRDSDRDPATLEYDEESNRYRVVSSDTEANVEFVEPSVVNGHDQWTLANTYIDGHREQIHEEQERRDLEYEEETQRETEERRRMLEDIRRIREESREEDERSGLQGEERDQRFTERMRLIAEQSRERRERYNLNDEEDRQREVEEEIRREILNRPIREAEERRQADREYLRRHVPAYRPDWRLSRFYRMFLVTHDTLGLNLYFTLGPGPDPQAHIYVHQFYPNPDGTTYHAGNNPGTQRLTVAHLNRRRQWELANTVAELTFRGFSNAEERDHFGAQNWYEN